ncbi:MAG: hypothetical protein ACI8S6_001169 [Myxococcota bacterium]
MAKNPGDAAAAMYAQRCRVLAVAPPEGWDGVSTLQWKQ